MKTLFLLSAFIIFFIFNTANAQQTLPVLTVPQATQLAQLLNQVINQMLRGTNQITEIFTPYLGAQLAQAGSPAYQTSCRQSSYWPSEAELSFLWSRGKLRWGYLNGNPPFWYNNATTGAITGAEYDLANAIVAAINKNYGKNIEAEFYETSFQNNFFDSLSGGLNSGLYDAVVNDVTATEARGKRVNFTCTYYVTNPGCVRGDLEIDNPAFNATQILSTADLATLANDPKWIIAVSNGTTTQQYLQSEADQSGAGAKIIAARGIDEVFLLVGNKTAHIGIADAPFAFDWLQKQQASGSCLQCEFYNSDGTESFLGADRYSMMTRTKTSKKTDATPIIVGVVVGIFGLLLVIVIIILVVLLLVRKRRTGFGSVGSSGSMEVGSIDEPEIDTKVLQNLEHSNFQINYNELEIIHPPIGKGGFAVVNKATYKGTSVAVKTFIDQEGGDEWVKEVTSLMRLRHPNIILFLGYVLRPLAIVTEFARYGSLYNVLQKKYPEFCKHGRRRRIIRDSVRGFTYLHSLEPPVLHRDIKSPNILLDRNWNAKIADFGIARAVDEKGMTHVGVGSVRWVAPEILKKQAYTTSADVYSFALLMWEMWSRKFPFVEFDFDTEVEKFVLEGGRPEMLAGIPKPYADVIAQCWKENPTERPSFVELGKMLDDIKDVEADDDA